MGKSINLKVKTLDAQTHEFTIDDEITVRAFKDKIAEKTSIAADQQRIIYCGRVLADEKQIKEFDVDGKVLHVAERPPPSQRGSASTTNDNPPPPRERHLPRGMRNSPLFRALDGMVVGTMAIPMNGTNMNNPQLPINPMTSSSSFCMNRITVARHMLECANNIAAYLEDPSRGLNNTSLDILTRGRWRMESTVVEVGISSDVPQSAHLVEMVQGAVSAALRRNGNTNVTVVQLPTVFGDTTGNTPPAEVEAMETSATSNNNNTNGIILEDITESEDDTTTIDTHHIESDAPNVSGTSNSGAAAANETANTSLSTGTNTDNNENNSTSRRRTSPRVLGEVIDQYFEVYERLMPFLRRYRAILFDDTEIEESERETSQRIYDRVSEAFHYLSHASHAISDLMLDLSQPAPRYLTCRPILVEQSGYVNSNNYLSAAAAAAAAAAAQIPQLHRRHAQHSAPNADGSARNTSTTATNTPASATATTGTTNSSGSSIDDPVDDVLHSGQSNEPPVQRVIGNNGHIHGNHDHMERLIQAVVDSTPVDAEFHVEINPPNILTFGVPVYNGQNIGSTQEQEPQQQQQQAEQQAQSPNVTGNENTRTPNAANQARVNTATLPTTSTQTRSTSRPQLQVGNSWNGRFIPTNMVTSFDRFLPCNSHHIRETENANNGGAAGGSGGGGGATNTVTAVRTAGNNITTPRSSTTTNNATRLINLLSNMSSPMVVGRTATTSAGSPVISLSRSNAANERTNRSNDNDSDAAISNTYRRNLRTQLLSFLNQNIFEGGPINESTIPVAVDRVLGWFGENLIYLAQYEKPEYDSQNSVINILRRMLPLFITTLNDNQDNPAQFEERLRKVCDEFMKRLYSVLIVCVGQANAELYWGQLMRLLLVPIKSNFRDEALKFICIYVNTNLPSGVDIVDAQQFVVRRNAEEKEKQAGDGDLISDVEMIDITATTSANAALTESATNTQSLTSVVASAKNEDLPSVTIGSEAWHKNFDKEWIPLITRDIQLQKKETPKQHPYSDAYISCMSAKRRKTIQSNKPALDLNSLVADSVRKSMQLAGVNTSTSSNHLQTANEIVEAIANDSAIQTAYSDTLRVSMRERLKNDPDYRADKFPQITKFIDK